MLGELDENNFESDDFVDPTTRRVYVIRWLGLLTPILLVLYSIYLAITPFDAQIQPTWYFLLIDASWLILGFSQFFIPPKKPAAALTGLAAYHILTLLYILFISGFDMPLIYTWAGLMLASAVYLGQLGVYISLATLFVAGAGAIIINASDDQKVASIILHFLGALIISYVVRSIIAAQAVDQAELLRSQRTERNQRNRILTIINNLSDAVICIDKNGIIGMYNAAAINLLDTNIDILGKQIDEIIKMVDLDGKNFKLTPKLRQTKTTKSRDDILATIHDETIRLNLIFSPIRSANDLHVNPQNGYIVILRDITKQKSLEDERNEFISVVSHELRTPITVAEGSLSNIELMIQRPDIPQERISSDIKLAHEQIVFLAKMVNDLSTLSRAERGVADTPEKIKVQELINELYTEYAPQAAQKNLAFDIDISPQVKCVNKSRLYLKELLQNLLSNAIKYTKEGSVTLSVKKTDDDKILFVVRDTGIGISRSDQAHLYQKFWRSEDYRTRETSGTGLGLYVSAKLARKLDTEIVTKSRLNHGSTFSFAIACDGKNRKNPS